eukprot:TRINITY_DN12366_c0_g1_i2.p1 TRINITY_DN12366_c0_g1~~TRINITY_DN12366_c0_g1_i2.p1  ORF type:complete len:199 (+),score=41.04 TRINITY_DN12366_c0_g1_i2:477-1073(+)
MPSSNEKGIANSEAVGQAELEDILRLSNDHSSCDIEDGMNRPLSASVPASVCDPTEGTWREKLFSWFWPEREKGKLSTEEVRRMEDFLLNSSKRPVNIASANRGQQLRQRTCPQTLTTEDLDAIQMQEFHALNNEQVRRRNQQAISEQFRRRHPHPELLPIWCIFAVPFSVAVLNIFVAYYIYPDIFSPFPEPETVEL